MAVLDKSATALDDACNLGCVQDFPFAESHWDLNNHIRTPSRTHGYIFRLKALVSISGVIVQRKYEQVLILILAQVLLYTELYTDI